MLCIPCEHVDDADDATDSDKSDGTVVLEKSPCKKKTSHKNKPPLRRQNAITTMSQLQTRSGKRIGVTSSQVPPAVVVAENDDTKHQEVEVLVKADVHRSRSVSPKSSN